MEHILQRMIVEREGTEETWQLGYEDNEEMEGDNDFVTLYLRRQEDGHWVTRFSVPIGETVGLPDIDGAGPFVPKRCSELSGPGECYLQGIRFLTAWITKAFNDLPPASQVSTYKDKIIARVENTRMEYLNGIIQFIPVI